MTLPVHDVSGTIHRLLDNRRVRPRDYLARIKDHFLAGLRIPATASMLRLDVPLLEQDR
jgi:hypothetical protein